MNMGFLFINGEGFSPWLFTLCALWNAGVLALWSGAITAAAILVHGALT